MDQKSTKKEKQSIRTPQILSSLICAIPALKKMKGKGKLYDALINALNEIDQTSSSRPSSKELQAKLSVSPTKLKKWIDALYEDFLMEIQEDSDLLHVTHTVCWIYVQGFREAVSFTCTLPIIPRVGESFNFPFLDAKIGSGLFYVYDVGYEWLNSALTVSIGVREGSYNKHFHYLRDKALYENQFDLGDFIGKSDHEIIILLNKIYR